jgi:hypothetical protein
VEADRVRGLDDVQRVYLLLRPKGARKYRLLIVGRKRLPDPGRHDRFWAFVYKVFRSRAALGDELGEVRYRTKTLGLRDEPEARPVAEGVYALVRHGDHTHLTYVLELPERPGPAERALNIRRQASYVIAVKNPEAASPPGAGLDPEHEARFPRPCEGGSGGVGSSPSRPPASWITPGPSSCSSGRPRIRIRSSAWSSSPTTKPSTRPTF